MTRCPSQQKRPQGRDGGASRRPAAGVLPTYVHGFHGVPWPSVARGWEMRCRWEQPTGPPGLRLAGPLGLCSPRPGEKLPRFLLGPESLVRESTPPSKAGPLLVLFGVGAACLCCRDWRAIFGTRLVPRWFWAWSWLQGGEGLKPTPSPPGPAKAVVWSPL